MTDTLFPALTHTTVAQHRVDTIKAISLWQPWASLVAAGVKMHETRHWPTSYRGPIAICAAKTVDTAGAPYELCRAVLGRHWETRELRGAVLAVATLDACLHTERMDLAALTSADRDAGNFLPGRFAWRLTDVRRFRTPVPITGRQGLFNWQVPARLDELLMHPLNHREECRRAGWL